MHQLANLLVILLVSLILSTSKFSPAAVAATSEYSGVQDLEVHAGEFGAAEHDHFPPGHTKEIVFQAQSQHSQPELNDDDESQDENLPTIGGSELASPMVASKTVPMDPRRSEAEEAVPPASSFDSGHLFGSRAGSSDLAFEKRRLCPAQPLPSHRGCTCPNQTICVLRNHRTCVQLKHDHENCGTCSHRCGEEQYCQDGKCHCQGPTLSVCGTACYNLRNNERHCGRCDHACEHGKKCRRGTCVPL